jgi:hypothetical protein
MKTNLMADLVGVRAHLDYSSPICAAASSPEGTELCVLGPEMELWELLKQHSLISPQDDQSHYVPVLEKKR